MKDPRRVRERITSVLDLTDIMISYGAEFKFDPKSVREVQFRCQFHGSDRNPSARLYRDTNSCYCWYCKKSWDPFSYVMEKEGLGYWQTLKYIVEKYHIDVADIPDIDFELSSDGKIVSEEAVEFMALKNRLTYLKRKLDFEKYRLLCGAFLMLSFQRMKGAQVKEGVNKLMEKLYQVEL